jgi:hypothetical protein
MNKQTVICTTYFSKKPHPNDPNDQWVVGRNKDGTVIQNDIKYIEPWYNSINLLGLNGIIFYDNLEKSFVDKYTTDKIRFIKTDTSDYSNNDWRFFVYRNFFYENSQYDYVFLTDGSDVSVVQDPSTIIDKYKYIDFFVCKDSILLSEFPYLNIHQQASWDNINWFIQNQKLLPLINMGVIGGSYQNMLLFLEKFCQNRIKLGFPEFNSDMWLGQYIFRNILSYKNLLIGEPFTSNFKKYETNRKDVYFVHK